MDIKRIVLWVAIVLLAIIVLYITFFKGSIDQSAVSSAGQVAQSSYSGMVGGC